MQEKYIIPRENRLVKSLSWSKVKMWLENRKQFIDTYFWWKPFFETKEIIFGSVLWNMIELWEYHDTEKIVDKVMRDFNGELVIDQRKEKIVRQSIENIQKNEEFIQKLQEMTFDFWSEFEIKMDSFIDDVYLIWFADNGTADWKMIKEFKTWKTAWTQSKVDNHWQMDFYALLTYLNKWYLPEDMELTWFPTKDDWNWWITITWEIKTFKFDVKKYEARILEWEEKIPKIFLEIQKEQIKWEKQKEGETEELVEKTKVMELADLSKEIKRLQEKEKELKKEVEDELRNNWLEKFALEGVWTAYFTKRKTFKYPDYIKELETEFKTKKKEYEKSDEAEFEEKETFTFRLS